MALLVERHPEAPQEGHNHVASAGQEPQHRTSVHSMATWTMISKWQGAKSRKAMASQMAALPHSRKWMIA